MSLALMQYLHTGTQGLGPLTEYDGGSRKA